MMIIVCCIIVLIAIVVLPIAIKMVISRINIIHYDKQDLHISFSLIGPHYLTKKSVKENEKVSNLEYIKSIVNSKNRRGGGIAMNKIADSGIMIYIYTSDNVKEFILKEDCFERPNNVKEFRNFTGLFMENGEKAYRSKSLFSKIFNYDGMEAFTPKICNTINQEFKKFIDQHQTCIDQFVSINLNDLFKPIMEGISNFIIFGRDDIRDEEDVYMLPIHLKMIMSLVVKWRSNPLFILFPDMSRRLGLIKELITISNTVDKQKDIIHRYINKRSGSDQLGDSIMDRIILHNMKCKEDGNEKDILDTEDIMGNYNLFQFAGTDTSQNAAKMAICHMSDKDHLIQYLANVVDQVYDDEGMTNNTIIESCEDLSIWTKECLRLHNPAPRTTGRKALRDVQIGSINVKRGDLVFILMTGLHNDTDYFKNPHEFDVGRFKKEKELPKYQYLPFSVGKRVCLGRHLGELMIKLLVTQFIRTFEVRKPKDMEYYCFSQVTSTVENPTVEIKVRKRE